MALLKVAAGLLLLSVAHMQMGAAHEDPNCTFVTEVGMVEGLSVAGAALSALGGASLAPSHHTVFLPNDDAFTALITTLNTTTEALLTDATLQNKTIAIFAYHVLAPDQNYTAAELVSNRTIATKLGELTGESYPLNFQRQTAGARAVRVRGVGSTASITNDTSTEICGRQVYIIDTVLLPGAVADIPNNVPELLAAELAAEEEASAEAPVPEAGDGDDSSAEGPSTAAPTSDATSTAISSLLLASVAAAAVAAL
mmetsp:Transcript_18872/g.57029  ORF Transcript_18872/g.57029 Transcript_18872/m.57029 type:complete len:255 (+) Transcript_18872:184-948(+)|eukprot:CAMPEP_0206136388 /NCGR_PEP_ID=MMETSP1473-20131121/1622_1 /ASSEMBLY_ACC=CAM_ASM_001109 /TAXON_ID=1461547 /ORGANISM="Stichococcus sp, Strain RCC1054" /LENGTH=254 /DNA_ID=CAMNT_0053528881 /DNA_START=91 /DNA_END=855 /DNA_ORIENTATION=+